MLEAGSCLNGHTAVLGLKEKPELLFKKKKKLELLHLNILFVALVCSNNAAMKTSSRTERDRETRHDKRDL